MPRPLRFEPYVHLAGLTDHEALVSWGGFFFRHHASSTGTDAWTIADEEMLRAVGRERRDTIGERSRTYGGARVQVFRASDDMLVREVETQTGNHVWVDGLAPDAEYTYRVFVDGVDWLDGERWDWNPSGEGRGLVPSDRRYSTRFRTHPSRDVDAPLVFAVLGDFGIGVRGDDEDAHRQRSLALGLERAVDQYGVRLVLTTGDNVYLGTARSGATGDDDDDWFFTFYQPYRYLLSRLPFYPAVGNHDAADTEQSDDREQLEDNYFIGQRFTEQREAERSSADPGLFYRFRYGASTEFVCLDTTRGTETEPRFFESSKHRPFLDESFPAGASSIRWRIPFSHHPMFCAGPSHPNNTEMEKVLAPLFERAGVRFALAGHEHNFQLSQHHGVHYVLSGAAGKLRLEPPQRFTEARTTAWASVGHFLVVELGKDAATIHVLSTTDDGALCSIALNTVGEHDVSLPLHIPAGSHP